MAEDAGHEDRRPRRLSTVVLVAAAVPVLAVLAFVALGLVAGPPRTTVLRLVVAPWRTTLGDAASAAGFAVTVAGLALMVRAGQVGSARRTPAAETVDALDGEQRRAAARAVAGRAPTPDDLLAPARALAVVLVARWTVMVLFTGLLLTALGRAVVAPTVDALGGPVAAAVVLTVLLVALVHRARRARDHLLHHPDRRTPPAVRAALRPWAAEAAPAAPAVPTTDPRGGPRDDTAA